MNIKDFIKDNIDLNIKRFRPKKEGYIYFICNTQGAILYIGTTCDMNSRATMHKQTIQFANKIFYFFSYPARLCLSKEAKLIEAIYPKYNRMHNGRYTESNKYHPLKVALKKKGITQVSLAKQFGVTRQAISLVLNGQGGRGKTQKKIEQLIKDLL